MTIRLARACAAVFICAAAVAGFGATLFPTAAGASGPAVKLTQNVLPGIQNMSSTSPVAPGTTIRIGVSLERPDPAAEKAFLQDVYNPSSSLFHHFLTPVQFNQRFGVQPQ